MATLLESADIEHFHHQRKNFIGQSQRASVSVIFLLNFFKACEDFLKSTCGAEIGSRAVEGWAIANYARYKSEGGHKEDMENKKSQANNLEETY